MTAPTPQALRAEAIHLRFEEGWKLDDIARHVGRAESTVSEWFRMHKGVVRKPVRHEPERIPPDTRTPAQRLMGDPPYERSALYKRGQA